MPPLNIQNFLYLSSTLFPFLYNSTHAGDQSEIEALRKECDAVKKKAKDMIDKYLTECNRLKAIVDEQQGTVIVLEYIFKECPKTGP